MKRINYKLAFISSPFQDRVTNQKLARKYTNKFMKMKKYKDCIPVVPHLLYPQLNVTEKKAIEYCRGLLQRCDYLVVCGNKITPGMEKEIEVAGEMGLPVIKISLKEAQR